MKNTIKIDNDTRKILIIGANGFLGKNILQIRANNNYEDQDIKLFAADLKNNNIPVDVPFYTIDITKRNEALKKIKVISPDIIILTAALTNVDLCETNKKYATKLNTEGPKNIIQACKKTDSKLVFISTDFVFDGTKEKGYYSEKDVPNPQNHYAKTKYNTEIALINSQVDYLICRTAVLYGWNREKLNFITWILNKLQNNEKISIVAAQINNATFVRNLAQILLKLIAKEAIGIFHTAGDGALSRYEMALKCAKIFNYNKDLITPLEMLKQKALRPKNAGLDITKLKKMIGSKLPIFSLDDGLNYMKKHRVE